MTAMRRALFAALAATVTVAASGCATQPEAEPTDVVAPVEESMAGGFDIDASAAALELARAAESEGRMSEAEAAYREAAWLWPDNLFAWEGLAAAARSEGDEQTAEAAAFVAERVESFPSQQLYVQRQVNDSLKRYIEERQGLPDANPTSLEFAGRLVSFYDTLYAERGTYTAPGRDFLNVEVREIPAVIGTGALGLFYGLSIGANAN